ncbi:MAG TPA: hypothetical protein ENN84_01725, partial [Candidatus Marinimicrobia bacterium]|nr:hypothetical protein [Candidatus Neomarinimicrobiota bacterium]
MPGESWPCDDYGQPLELLFQIIDLKGEILPLDIKVLQFFYKRQMLSRYDNDWLIKTYSKFTPRPGCCLKKPKKHHEAPFCTIAFENIKTLPSWETICNFHREIIQICK